MTPEKLVEKMVDAGMEGRANMTDILRIVLKEIQDGGVVDAHAQFIGAGDVYAELKPEYKKFMEDGK